MGSTSGSGTFAYGTNTTISATPLTGYHFVQWSDGNSDNPRTVTVTGPTTYTANFAHNDYLITGVSADGSMGSVSGGGYYAYNETATLVPEPSTGYRFVQWQDGNTDNPRSFTVTGNATYTATFAICNYTVNVTSGGNGTASGGGVFNYGMVTTLTATPSDHYHFVQWSDGNTDNPRALTVTSDLDLTATFAIDQITVTALSTNDTYGVVSGGGVKDYGETVTLTASATEGHSFVRWTEDGNTSPSRTFTATTDVTWTAEFSVNKYTVNVATNEPLYGSATGGGTYDYNTTASLAATPSEGCHFVKWSDGNTDNPRSLTVTSDTSLTAEFDIDMYEVNAIANNLAYGTTTGSGTYAYGAVATLTASANEGYEFVRWSDGNTDATRNVSVTGNISLTAEFATAQYTLSATTPDAQKGSVSGDGTYAHGAVATLTATAETGYYFTGWSDGISTNPRSVTVLSDTSFTALFEAYNYTVTVVSSDDLKGNVSGGGTYPYGTSITISATPLTGYHLTGWNDGDENEIRSVTVTGDVTYYANFAYNAYTITALSADDMAGSVSGGGPYDYNETATLTAVPSAGYRFVQWQDGNTANPRSFSVTGNATYTATFAICNYTVNVTSGGNGTVSGGGVFNYGMVTTLTATPSDHYHFVQWSDGNTDNPRALTVTSDLDLTATFAIDQITVTALSTNDTYGVVSGGGVKDYGETVTLTASATEGHSFVRWTEDGNTSPSRTFTATTDVTWTAEFSVNKYTVNVATNEPLYGSATGGGTYDYNTTAVLTATPSEGCHFVRWSDGNADNPRSLTVTSDTSLTAEFDIDTYVVTATTNGLLYGTTTGSGTYTYGETVNLSATANDGYKFDHWSDGSEENPRTFIATSDVNLEAIFVICNFTVAVTPVGNGTVSGNGTYNCDATVTVSATASAHHHLVEWGDGESLNPRTVTTDLVTTAVFAIDTFEVVAEPDDDSYGSVSGSGDYAWNTTATLVATALPGHYFVKWSDNVPVATRYVTVTSDTILTAIFEKEEYDVIVSANDDDFGSVSGDGTYEYGEVANLSAVANAGYEFVSWSDGDVNANRNVVVTQDTNLVATFALKSYVVTLTCNDDAFGVANGGGTYGYGEIANLIAIANPGYEFIRWSDGNTNASRSVEVTSDITLEALFMANHTVTAVPDNATHGSVSGGGTYTHGSTATLTASAGTGYHFKQWSDGVVSVSRNVVVMSDTLFVAEFAIDTFNITVVPNIAERGSTDEGGRYTYGSVIVLSATANDGYEFVEWSDGVTANPRTVTVTKDSALIAYFDVPVSLVYDTITWSEKKDTAWAVFYDSNNPMNRYSYRADIDSTKKAATCDVPGLLVAKYKTSDTTYTDTVRITMTNNMSLIKSLWTDVVTIIDPEHEFVGYEWTHNGNYVGDEPYVSETRLTGSYRLIATRENGERVCSNVLNFQELRSSSTMKVYPNPARDYVTIEGGDWKVGDEVLLINSQGQVEAQHTINKEKKFTIALYGLDDGVYYLKVNEESAKVIVKK